MGQSTFSKVIWGIFTASAVLPFIAWGNSVNWSLSSLGALQYFPLFGLLAWMIMWTHYVSGALRIKYPDLSQPKYYSKLTSWIVLFSLLLHPGLLSYKLWSLTDTTPPGSWFNFVPGMKLAVILGSIALIIFLSFEVFDRMKDNALVKKYWLLISISQSLAMTLIFVHGLRVGTRLQEGWFMWAWLLCGLALIPCLYLIHKSDLLKK